MVVSREARGAIRTELMIVLRGIGEIHTAADHGDYARARALRRRHGDVLRLLDDLGWSPEDPGERFAITMPTPGLVRVLRLLEARTVEALDAHVREGGDHARQSVRYVLALVAACGSIVTQVVGADEPDPEREG